MTGRIYTDGKYNQKKKDDERNYLETAQISTACPYGKQNYEIDTQRKTRQALSLLLSTLLVKPACSQSGILSMYSSKYMYIMLGLTLVSQTSSRARLGIRIHFLLSPVPLLKLLRTTVDPVLSKHPREEP